MESHSHRVNNKKITQAWANFDNLANLYLEMYRCFIHEPKSDQE